MSAQLTPPRFAKANLVLVTRTKFDWSFFLGKSISPSKGRVHHEALCQNQDRLNHEALCPLILRPAMTSGAFPPPLSCRTLHNPNAFVPRIPASCLFVVPVSCRSFLSSFLPCTCQAYTHLTSCFPLPLAMSLHVPLSLLLMCWHLCCIN